MQYVELLNFGCRFSLYPMSDNFISIILGSLEKTDTTHVYSFTDSISTVYQGAMDSVNDRVKAVFINAWQPDVHMAMECSFSNSLICQNPPAENGLCPNILKIKDIHFPVKCKLVLACDEKGQEVYSNLLDRAAGRMLLSKISYGMRLEGDIHEVFMFIEALCARLDFEGVEFILNATLSVNSPTAE